MRSAVTEGTQPVSLRRCSSQHCFVLTCLSITPTHAGLALLPGPERILGKDFAGFLGPALSLV